MYGVDWWEMGTTNSRVVSAVPFVALRDAAQLHLSGSDKHAVMRIMTEKWGGNVARMVDEVLGATVETRGYLYIFDPGEMTGVWKIGKTDNLEKRIGGYQTGRVKEVNFKYTYPTLNQHLAENMLKSALEPYRYQVVSTTGRKHGRKELFQMSYALVAEMLVECCVAASAMYIRLQIGGSALATIDIKPESKKLVERYSTSLLRLIQSDHPPKWYVPGVPINVQTLIEDMKTTVKPLPDTEENIAMLLREQLATMMVGTPVVEQHTSTAAAAAVTVVTQDKMVIAVDDAEDGDLLDAKIEMEESVVVEGMIPISSDPIVAYENLNKNKTPRRGSVSSTPTEKRKSADGKNLAGAPDSIQQFLKWMMEAKPSWYQSGQAMSFRRLREYYKGYVVAMGSNSTIVGDRVFNNRVREIVGCAKMNLVEDGHTLAGLVLP
jgi:hypothetical protein